MFLLFGVVAIVVGGGAEEGAAERPVRGVFLTVEPPALSGDELALLDELEHVASCGQLEAALTEDVSVLAIDESALGVLPAGFLAEQYNSGVAVLGSTFSPGTWRNWWGRSRQDYGQPPNRGRLRMTGTATVRSIATCAVRRTARKLAIAAVDSTTSRTGSFRRCWSSCWKATSPGAYWPDETW
jgi:hypothetical protein